MKRFKNVHTARIILAYSPNVEVARGKILELGDETLRRCEANIALYVSKKYLVEVDGDATEDTTAPGLPKYGVVLPEGVKPEERHKAVIVAVATPAEDPNDSGTMILGSNVPGEGKLKSVDAILKEKTDEMNTSIGETVKELSQAEAARQKKERPMPADLAEWFQLRHARKKKEVLHTADLARLHYLLEWDEDTKIQKVIKQRVREIEEAKVEGEEK